MSNIQNFIGCDCDYADAEIVLFGAPFDGTTSFRPGARFAPQAIRISSDDGIETYSPYQERDLYERAICDMGDLTLPFGNASSALDVIERTVRMIAGDDKRPVMIGGEHLVTLGAVRALVSKYPDLHMIHFDAHADLRDEYLGETLSHATVMRRVFDLVGDGRIFQYGIRSGDQNEFLWSRSHVYTHMFDCGTLDDALEAARDKPVYLSIDLDVLDPSLFPGTGTPEAGGVPFNELLSSVIKLSGARIVGADLCELSPHYDPSGTSTLVACKMLRELLLIV